MASKKKKLVLRTLGALAGSVTLAAGYVYAVSEWKMHRTFDAPLTPFRTPAVIDVAEGMRMAKILGCWAGCHGMEGGGGREHIEGIVEHTAPTLSAVLPLYTDEELVRLIRYGVKRDGHSALGMISYTFWPLSDTDLGNIIGHLRSQPAVPAVPRKLKLSLRGRIALVTGEWKVSAEQVDRSIPRWGELPQTTQFERGRYLASITCTECHGLDFGGNELEGGPSLVVLAAYPFTQFRHLLRTGEPISGRDLGIMSWTARVAFSLFTEQEIGDLWVFLRIYHGLEASLPLIPESLFIVVFDGTAITVTAPDEEKQSVAWASLTKVVIRTTDEGPFNPDVFWDFYAGGEKPVAVFPGGATGESQLLEAMQARLPAFNNGEVIEAMTSIENASFLIWEPVASGPE